MKKQLLTILSILCIYSCKTVDESTSYVERHQMDSFVNKVDSLFGLRVTSKSDSVWHDTFIRELHSIKEHNDTSHQVVVDTAGNVIKETIIIKNTKETVSETDRKELEMVISKMETMDSTMRAMTCQIEQYDSLISVSNKESVKEVTKIPKIFWYSMVFSILVIIFAIIKLIRWLQIH